MSSISSEQPTNLRCSWLLAGVTLFFLQSFFLFKTPSVCVVPNRLNCALSLMSKTTENFHASSFYFNHTRHNPERVQFSLKHKLYYNRNDNPCRHASRLLCSTEAHNRDIDSWPLPKINLKACQKQLSVKFISLYVGMEDCPNKKLLTISFYRKKEREDPLNHAHQT